MILPHEIFKLNCLTFYFQLISLQQARVSVKITPTDRRRIADEIRVTIRDGTKSNSLFAITDLRQTADLHIHFIHNHRRSFWRHGGPDADRIGNV